MNREKLLNVAIGVLVVCAVAMTAVTLQRQVFGPAAAAAIPMSPAASLLPEGEVDYAARGHAAGSPSAPVTLVVFSDFQCGACAMLADQLRVLRQEYPDELRIVYRHFPLRIHPHARAAAEATECAAAQGRFDAFHDLLFAGQDAIGEVPWRHFAQLARVPDLEEFARCLEDGRTRQAVERDASDGRRLGATGTPTVLVNRIRIRGVVGVEALRGYVDTELAGG